MSQTTEPIHQIDVSHDGKTVWINASDGSCIGRFSKVFGMDAHRTVTEMLKGQPECLACSKGAAGPGEWQQFREAMAQHYGIHIAEGLLRF